MNVQLKIKKIKEKHFLRHTLVRLINQNLKSKRDQSDERSVRIDPAEFAK